MTELLVSYADDSSWEEWQREYRHGAFYIFPPAGVIEPLDVLRQTCDPQSAAICQAHISLSRPLTAPLTASGFEELRAVLSTIAPCTIHYGPLRDFPPCPGVTCAITPEEPFRQLRAAIHRASHFAGHTWQRDELAPHLTIAEFITVERTAELLRELQGHVPEGTFLCDKIEYAVPNNTFYFERVLALPFGRTSSQGRVAQ
jgi:2'-5' RNA ligase